MTAKKAVFVLVTALAGALLNLGTMLFVQDVLRAPLFMDTLFTVAATFLGGLPSGLATAVLTHLVTNPLVATPLPGYLYTLCNIAVALLVALFMRRFPVECAARPAAGNSERPGLSERITVLFLLSLAMCFLISLLGGIIATVIEVFFIPWNENSAEMFIFRRMLVRKIGGSQSGLSLLLVEILCRVPVNIMDRLLSVYGGYGVAVGAAFMRSRLRPERRGVGHQIS
jgi:hypothetical protein